MRTLRILAGVLSAAALACGLLFMLNADWGIGGALIISGAILFAGLLIASAIAESK